MALACRPRSTSQSDRTYFGCQIEGCAWLTEDPEIRQLLDALEEKRRQIEFMLSYLERMPPEEQALELTKREKQIAELLDAGQKNVQIAKSLGIAASTVKIHKKNISNKRELAEKDHIAADAVVRYLGDTGAKPPDPDIDTPFREVVLQFDPARKAPRNSVDVDRDFDTQFQKE